MKTFFEKIQNRCLSLLNGIENTDKSLANIAVKCMVLISHSVKPKNEPVKFPDTSIVKVIGSLHETVDLLFDLKGLRIRGCEDDY